MTSRVSDEEDSTQIEQTIDSSMAIEPKTPPTEPMMTSQVSDEEDSTQTEQEIQALFSLLDNYITNLEGKLTDAKSSKAKIKALLEKAIQLLIDELKIKAEDSEDKRFIKRDGMVAPSYLTRNNTVLQQIQFLVRKLDRYMAKVDKELHVLENISFLREEIDRDREEATTLKLTLEICDTRNDLEVGSLVTYANQWMNNQKTQSVESVDTKGYV